MKKNGKILLIKLSSLGDVIFNIPLANSLKKAGYHITWLVSEKGYDILNGNPCIDDVILAPFEKWKKQKFRLSFEEYITILKEIKRRQFDIIIDTQGRWKSLIFTLFSGVKRRIAGSDSKELARFGATKIVKIPSGWDINVVDKYLCYAKHLNVLADSRLMSLPPSQTETQEKVSEFLKDIDPKKPLVILCPATTWTTKHWYKDNWKELVSLLENRFNLVFTGNAMDFDYIEYINCSRGLNLAGKTNLKELIELFRRSSLVISLDSGSTHLSNASGARAIVSIYCSTPESFYAPIGDKYVAVGGNVDCRPCHKTKCKKKNGYLACTKVPTPDEVFQIVNRLIIEE